MHLAPLLDVWVDYSGIWENFVVQARIHYFCYRSIRVNGNGFTCFSWEWIGCSVSICWFNTWWLLLSMRHSSLPIWTNIWQNKSSACRSWCCCWLYVYHLGSRGWSDWSWYSIFLYNMFIILLLTFFLNFIEKWVPSITDKIESINWNRLSPMFCCFIATALIIIDINTSFGSLSNLIEIHISLTIIWHRLIIFLVSCCIRLIRLRSSFAVNGGHRLETSCWIESLLRYFIIRSYFLI